MRKMGIEGVGLKIIIPAAISVVIIYFVNQARPEWFYYVNDKNTLMWLFWILLGLGVLFWLGSAVQLLISWRKKKLITSGFFAVFLNPLYVAWILFIIPAISLYLNSWLYLLASVVFFAAMRKFVGEEEEFLRSTFGQEYENYRKKVCFIIFVSFIFHFHHDSLIFSDIDIT